MTDIKQKVEPIVKTWYDYLAEGKLMGLKCKKCGTVHFPPFPICRECAGYDMEWTEASNKATVRTLGLVAAPDKWFAEYAPFYHGYGETDDGSSLNTMLFGVDATDDTGEELEKIMEKLPIRVTIEIQDRGDYHYPVFRYNGEEE